MGLKVSFFILFFVLRHGVGRLILHTNTHDLIMRTSPKCEHTLSFNLHKNKATTEAADGAQI